MVNLKLKVLFLILELTDEILVKRLLNSSQYLETLMNLDASEHLVKDVLGYA